MRLLTGLTLLLLLLATPGRADRLNVGMTAEPASLDPARGMAADVNEIVYGNIFEGLTRIDESGAVRPALAGSWTVSEDGLVHDFQLRRGVTFHDGSEFTAEDAVFSLARLTGQAPGGRPDPRFARLRLMEALDATSLRLTLDRPDPEFLWKLAQGAAVITDPGSAAGNGRKPVGTGPYRFVEWRPGEAIIFRRNTRYWGPAPLMARITFRFYPSAADQVRALKNGHIDYLPDLADMDILREVEQLPDYTVSLGGSEGEVVMAMNLRRERFQDPRVRIAITHAINRANLIQDAMKGLATPIGSHFTPRHPAYLDLTGLHAFDPDRARALLAAAGYPDGFQLQMKLPPPLYARRTGEVLAKQLEQIGLQVDREQLGWGEWLATVYRGERDFDVTVFSHGAPRDIGLYAARDNYMGYDSDRFRGIINRLDEAREPERRNRLYGDAQRSLSQDAPAVYLFMLPRIGILRYGLRGIWQHAPLPATDLTGAYWQIELPKQPD